MADRKVAPRHEPLVSVTSIVTSEMICDKEALGEGDGAWRDTAAPSAYHAASLSYLTLGLGLD